MTVADFLDQYYERYVVAESLRSIASIRSRLAALKEGLGTLPVSALERTDTIEDFKREYGKTRSLAAVNRTLSILRHAITGAAVGRRRSSARRRSTDLASRSKARARPNAIAALHSTENSGCLRRRRQTELC